MDFWIWTVLPGVVGVVLAGVWWKRRARHGYVIDHVRVEMYPASVVEDRVVEIVWRAAISMKNISRQPRTLPVFAERATVRAGRRVYLANVYLDADMTEVNPGDVALAWAEFVLPADSLLGSIHTMLIHRRRTPRALKFAPAGASGTNLPVVVINA